MLPSSSSLHFSLNAKDELHAPSPDASLQSLGVADGKLVYFSLNPNAFSSIISEEELQALTPFQESNQMPETPIQQSTQIRDSTPKQPEIFLRRVLRKELGNERSNHKRLMTAVHAVLLESGFVGFDSVSRMRIEELHLPDEWPSSAFTLSLWYTLPQLLTRRDYGSNMTDCVVLKCQSLGHFITVYGSLVNGGSGLCRLCLDEYRFAPIIDLVWGHCDKSDMVDDAASLNPSPENEVFEFWKIVKDGLALPLLIDLCDKTDLALPACLIRLPTELKLKILESLSAVDIVNMGSVCSEMRYLASSNDLWKQKFAEEFGDGREEQGMVNLGERLAMINVGIVCSQMRNLAPSNDLWKQKFAKEFGHGTGEQGMVNWREKFISHWKRRKKQNLAGSVIGGDSDRLPGLAAPPPFVYGRPGQPFPRFRARQTFGPQCRFGGR